MAETPGEPQPVLTGMSFLEGPRWRDGRIWVSDFYTHRVLSARADGSDVRTEAEVPQQPSGLGWLPDGRLLIVSMRDRRILRRESDGALAVHADLSGRSAHVLNDMIVDAGGRAWVGSFGFDLMNGAPRAAAPLLRVDPDGTVTTATEPLHFANGPALTGGELVVAETFGNRLSAFPVGPDGTLGERRDWARFGEVPVEEDPLAAIARLTVAPDGISAPDAEGAIWVADAAGNRAIRVRPGGEIADEVSTGEVGTYACQLGGEDGRTLFLCTAPGFAEHERRDTRVAELLAVRVPVPAA
ncbi:MULTISPECIES: SMP-30/gluconolactonase/LRE family protein [unclassified Pseudonocardia]|uniref:SMP-30/gluconolactonase/LRE family protein n=1 Tax=unclassified Pseudonocardia TaxID=2619320 RepID=UPI0001FFE487|nr:SMP-30/gluconolactonase/LRE family protein [Pseudonocardia sp. Ae707_Ps1]OLM19195.1 5-valerolactone hydrolase [Pseudonocardia sp. Ae707_Ps1]